MTYITEDAARGPIFELLRLGASRILDRRAALICTSPDPFAMVHLLQPVLKDPQDPLLDPSSPVPEVYYQIAQFECDLRAARAKQRAASSAEKAGN